MTFSLEATNGHSQFPMFVQGQATPLLEKAIVMLECMMQLDNDQVIKARRIGSGATGAAAAAVGAAAGASAGGVC